jgi:hypothetical protein
MTGQAAQALLMPLSQPGFNKIQAVFRLRQR